MSEIPKKWKEWREGEREERGREDRRRGEGEDREGGNKQADGRMDGWTNSWMN